MSAPSIFETAIVAGTPVARRARTVLPRARYIYFDLLLVNNRSSTTLTIMVNGTEEVTIGAGQVANIDKDEYGPITHYTVDSDANVVSGAFDIREYEGTAVDTESARVAEL